jgi:hypothetical protein
MVRHVQLGIDTLHIKSDDDGDDGMGIVLQYSNGRALLV